MELSAKQQIFEIIKKGKKTLLTTQETPSEDAASALIAMGLYLEKNGKDVDMVIGGGIPEVLKFLPKTEKIKQNLSLSKNFVISLDTSEISVEQFSYDFDKDNKKLNIYITPDGGAFTKDHISTDLLGFGYDSILVINCADFDKIGSLYTKNTDLFYETEVVNIDYDSANEQYGEVNLVDATASSVSEVIYDLLETMDEKAIDKNIATCLLTGITAATKSFQSLNATPQAFATSAKLISSGADRQMVINHLYKNKSLATLKLWGRVLARVKHDPETKIAWSLISHKDFLNSGAQIKDLDGIVDEIMGSVNKTDISLVIYESQEQGSKSIKAIAKTSKPSLIDLFAKDFNISPKNGTIKIKTESDNLLAVESDILRKLKKLARP